MNGIAAFQAWRFTHFTAGGKLPESADKLSTREKIKALFVGVPNPRPANIKLPALPYEVVSLQGRKKITCWYIPAAQSSRGTVCLFHGYSGEKSRMLDKAYVLHAIGYNVLLTDFVGSGGSEGNETTIGYKEAEDVKICFRYIVNRNHQKTYLLGTSLGAAAVLRAIAVDSIKPDGIIIECPFATLYGTVCTRFDMMHVPSFPMAGLLTFWGGVENGFNAFEHNPVSYAKSVRCPALLLWGEKDDRVSRKEIDDIYQNLGGKKYLKTYPLSGHIDYLFQYKKEWTADVSSFLENN